MGLSVATPSFLVSEKASPPKRQNPDFITTGFPTIDDALGGGFKRGTYNIVYGPECQSHQTHQTSLLLKSIAIKAASDLSQRSSVLFISTPQSHKSNNATPFDGLLTTIQFLDWNYIGNYDLVVIDRPRSKDWKEETLLSRTLSFFAHEHNMAIVQRKSMGGYYPRQTLYSAPSLYPASSALLLKSHLKEEWILGNKNRYHEFPTLEILKNRYGSKDVKINLTKVSIHFYEEAS